MNLAFEDRIVKFLSILQIVRGTLEARIRSFSIGSYPYESLEIDLGRPLLDRTYIYLL